MLVEAEDYRVPIISILNNDNTQLNEKNQATLIARARTYTLIDGTLHKKGVVQPLLKCICASFQIQTLSTYVGEQLLPIWVYETCP